MDTFIDAPNYTQFPNVFLDHWLPILPPHEFCVLSFMVRKIFGFHKEKDGDRMSISQIATGTGQTARGIINQVKSLIKRGLIIRFKGKTNKGDDDTNLFTINIKNNEKGSECDSVGVVNATAKGVVNGIHTQKKQYTKENQQKKEAAIAAAAVFSCLDKVDIPKTDKEWLTSHYSNADVEHAIKYATHPETKITTSLQQALKWAAKTKPPIPVVVSVVDNYRIAKDIESRVAGKTSCVVAGTSGIEVYFAVGNVLPVAIPYDAKNFKDLLRAALSRFGVRLKDSKEL